MVDSPPLEQITQQIVESLQPQRIVMFGSRARGDQRPDSDLDLMIEMESDETAIRRMQRVYRLFGASDWSMDVVVYPPDELVRLRQQPNSLVCRIEAEGRR